MSNLRELFGGTIKMDLPSNFIDASYAAISFHFQVFPHPSTSSFVASDLRQVPDTQEVFLDPASDMSVILEILQRVDIKDSQGAAKFHFDSLAHDNSASAKEILDIILPPESQTTSPPGTPHPIILHGEQQVRKYNRHVPDRVCIFVALYRIEAKGIDLVLTANVPFSPRESSDEEALKQARHRFDKASASLRIVDFGLFA